jgi:hypothetical protein
VRRTSSACAALALLCLGGPAIAGAAPADLHLDASPERTPRGPVVVKVLMSTTADGRREKITVRAYPGEVPCLRRQPLVLPAKTTIDVLFGVRLTPRLRWDDTVSFVAPNGPRLTICGYVVDEAARRAGKPYVHRTVRTDVRLPPAAPAPPVRRQSCTPSPANGLVRLDALRLGDRACTVARRVAEAWIADFAAPPNPRENWGFGWRTPGGKILRISAPRLRVSRLVVPGRAGSLMCRESPIGTALLAPLEVDCEVASFRVRRV